MNTDLPHFLGLVMIQLTGGVGYRDLSNIIC